MAASPVRDIATERRQRLEDRISAVTGEPTGRLLLNPTDTAYVLSISRTTCYALAASGDLPSVKVGTCLRFPVEALRLWIANNTRGAV